MRHTAPHCKHIIACSASLSCNYGSNSFPGSTHKPHTSCNGNFGALRLLLFSCLVRKHIYKEAPKDSKGGWWLSNPQHHRGCAVHSGIRMWICSAWHFCNTRVFLFLTYIFIFPWGSFVIRIHFEKTGSLSNPRCIDKINKKKIAETVQATWWTKSGACVHLSESCYHLRNKKDVFSMPQRPLCSDCLKKQGWAHPQASFLQPSDT